MRYRPLGKSGIDASVVGFGTWAIGGWMWGGSSEKDAIKAIHAGIDHGVNLIDTAPMYGFGHSEEIVGKAIAGRRGDVVLATKCGLVWHVEQGDFFFKTDDKHPSSEGDKSVYKCQRPEVIRYEVEQSLRRLKTDCIDLYQTHWQDSTTAIADTMGELMRLKQEGKIRAIGCSNATPEQMKEYLAAGDLDVDQEKYSMLDRGLEESNLPFCADNEVAFLAYSPLAQGLLTGKIGPERQFDEGDLRNNNKRFNVENRAKIAGLLDDFRDIAEAHSASFGQLAIAWALEQRGSSHALVGARNPEQAIENAVAGAIEIGSGEVKEMNRLIADFSLA